MLEKAKQYAIDCHESTNHTYDKVLPYSHHLQMVYEAAIMFIHLVPADERENVLAACWTHDTIEDCRQTYNDVEKVTNKRVADLTYAVSNEKGKTRKERANEKYYSEMRNIPDAVFVKLADRIANVTYSIRKGSSMAKKYKEEHSEFIRHLSKETENYIKYEEMITHLAKLFTKI